MFRRLKQKTRQRLRGYFREEIALASRDIDLARQQKATSESAEFVDRSMPMTKSYPDKFALLRAAIAQVEIAGLYCEFGVYRGETINFIASLAQAEIHGFDSFEGLPEDWRTGHEKGTFALSELPEVRANVRLHRGWFENSIPDFKRAHAGPIAFLHLDADLYSSTRTVLELLGDRIVASTVLQFDEFFNYPGWQEGEYKAFSEFCSKRTVEARYVGYTRFDQQVAVKIASIAPLHHR
jgi:Macrocin-O-methyltransferase (TylF)